MKHILILVLVLFCITPMRISAQTKVYAPADSKPVSLGFSVELQSKVLNETRTLNILLPIGYHPDSAATYPVIYLLDGSADEDYTHVGSLVQFLNMYSIVPDAIVVGIANIDRKRDFTFPTTVAEDKKTFPTTGGSAKFIAFIENELQPYIQLNYKTNNSKTIIGQSLGGLLATEILCDKPDLFTQYIIVSPSLWWDRESLLKKLTKKLETTPLANKKIYLCVGNEHPTMIADAKILNGILEEQGKKSSALFFQFFEKEDHATILHRAVYDALERFYPKEKK
jgi:uncharacterized protein